MCRLPNFLSFSPASRPESIITASFHRVTQYFRAANFQPRRLFRFPSRTTGLDSRLDRTRYPIADPTGFVAELFEPRIKGWLEKDRARDAAFSGRVYPSPRLYRTAEITGVAQWLDTFEHPAVDRLCNFRGIFDSTHVVRNEFGCWLDEGPRRHRSHRYRGIIDNPIPRIATSNAISNHLLFPPRPNLPVLTVLKDSSVDIRHDRVDLRALLNARIRSSAELRKSAFHEIPTRREWRKSWRRVGIAREGGPVERDARRRRRRFVWPETKASGEPVAGSLRSQTIFVIDQLPDRPS